MSESAPILGPEATTRAGARASMRDGVVTFAVAVSLVVAVASVHQDAWFVAALVLLAPPLTAIAVVDARTHRIPNRLVLASLAVAVVTVTGRAFTEPDVALRAVVAGVVVGLVYLLLWRLADLGLGDAKLAATLALVAGWSGWQTVVAFVVLAHLLQVPVALCQLARRRREKVAFAPALVVSLYLAVALARLV